ncbi:MAG: transcription termination/antitermination protein NusA [Acidobacteria bacterium]|nr:transcription termination/antitermination protein NusA [Acidobacteriota bacterium]
MANTLTQTIEQISKEKGINPEIIQHALEDAMVAAAKKYFKTNEDLQARFDPETGTIEVFAVKRIVEEVTDESKEMSLKDALEIDETFNIDDYIEIPKPTGDLGRIAAQTAKQVIFQKVREAEREIIFGEFSGQTGQLVNGIVRRLEGRDIIVDLGKTEAVLPFSEQSRAEQYKPGDRIRAAIVKVHRLSKGPQIVISRTDPQLLIRLFEMEIPEIYDGTVIIKNAVREAGERAKVAVMSKDENVDPVGACVGMKGSRINSIIRELRGEKIDIIEYSDDTVEYAINALNPAKISKVLVLDPSERVLEVIVQEDQLSLAIGKKGQNVRLASKLLGWQIEIKSEEEKKQEIISQMDQLAVAAGDPLSELEGLGEKTRARLGEAGFESIQELASASLEQLTALPGIGEKTAQKLISAAQAHLSGAQTGEESLEEEFKEQQEQGSTGGTAQAMSEEQEPRTEEEPEKLEDELQSTRADEGGELLDS